MAQTGKTPALYTVILLLLLGGALIFFPVSLPPGAGDGDFQAYWSSTYLLAQGRDYSDSDAIGEIERSLTNWDEPETLYAWFSPIGNVVLLPFTFLPFGIASYYWLILNIIILFYSALLLWERSDSRLWIPLLTVFGFSMTIVSLVCGQINFMEVLGLALFFSLQKSNRQYLAGTSLVLTTIKPHLVILTLPILFLDLLRKRDCKTLTGFFATLVLCFIVLFAFYPPWIQSLLIVITSGMSTIRETPNINGLLVLFGIYKIGKWIWLVALVTGIVWWWKRGHTWDRRTFIDLSIIAGLILAPIGWSYDQIMLLIPILSILSWIVKRELPQRISKTVIIILVVANLAAYILRAFTPSDVWFFWVPYVALWLYWYGQRNRNGNHHITENHQ
jgi:hypothetical protein